MNAGDVIRLARAKDFARDGRSYIEYVLPRGDVSVCLVLGTEDKKLDESGVALDVAAALRDLGFVPQRERDALHIALQGLEALASAEWRERDGPWPQQILDARAALQGAQ